MSHVRGATIPLHRQRDRKSTRLNSSHSQISYAVFCLKKKTITNYLTPKKTFLNINPQTQQIPGSEAAPLILRHGSSAVLSSYTSHAYGHAFVVCMWPI